MRHTIKLKLKRYLSFFYILDNSYIISTFFFNRHKAPFSWKQVSCHIELLHLILQFDVNGRPCLIFCHIYIRNLFKRKKKSHIGFKNDEYRICGYSRKKEKRKLTKNDIIETVNQHIKMDILYTQKKKSRSKNQNKIWIEYSLLVTQL